MSDILIRGMEMPRNCEECDVKVVCKNYWKLIREQYTRPSWCPLVPVQPHGRCIDADALPWYLRDVREILEMPTIIPASEEVYASSYDTAGNYHWAGTRTGEHIVPTENGEA